MPADTVTRPASPPAARPASAAGGWVKINPRFASRLAALGVTTPTALLDLPGEVVSGHPDRHVVRVVLPGWGTVLYLKRQHRVTWKERLRQRLAGFGWSSRCAREANLLRELEASGFPGPSWVACGEDGRGRAFLLVEELTGAIELRRLLSDTGLSPEDRSRLAERLGQAVAELHAAGFDTPDLTAKHIFVNPESFALTLIDWQSARRLGRLGHRARSRSLAALHASLADTLATRSERLRFLWAYLRVARRNGFAAPRFSAVIRRIERLAARARQRRSVRDQRQPVVTSEPDLRLVWLAGEAVCAVPDVAAVWPTPAVAPPFYDTTPAPAEAVRIRLPDGRTAELVRFKTTAPVGRFLAWVRGRPWRSPGATLGRVLFHLRRYGLPAPRLFAFGQRDTEESFALYEPPEGVPLDQWLAGRHPPALRREVQEQVEFLLRKLHDAGCRPADPVSAFCVTEDPAPRVSVGGVGSVRIVRRLSAGARDRDLRAVRAAFATRQLDAS